MADNWTQGSFAFRCTRTERALIQEAVNGGHDICAARDPDPPSSALLAAFPPTDGDEPWSGFCDAFDDPDFPCLSGDFAAVDDPDDLTLCLATFASMDDFDPSAIATVIQRCCPETLAKAPIGFEWATVCSRPRVGEFGGGWCAIFADRIELESTDEALGCALAGDII